MNETPIRKTLETVIDPDELYDVAIRVFLKKGLEQVTLKDVAEALKIDESCLTERVTDKNGLMLEACRWYFIRFSQQIRATMATHSDLYAAVEAVLHVYVEMCVDEFSSKRGKLIYTIVDLTLAEDATEQEMAQLKTAWEDQLRDKFRQCRDELKDPEDHRALAQYYLTLMEGIYEVLRYGATEEDVYRTVSLALDPLEKRMKN